MSKYKSHVWVIMPLPEKLYIREYTSGNLRKKWSYCLQTALNISCALLSQQLENWRQLCVRILPPKSAVKSSRRTRRIFSTNTISLPFTAIIKGFKKQVTCVL